MKRDLNLREQRIAAGYTYRRAAARSGIPASTIKWTEVNERKRKDRASVQHNYLKLVALYGIADYLAQPPGVDSVPPPLSGQPAGMPLPAGTFTLGDGDGIE